MKVRDVMIPVIGHVDPDDTLRDAAEKMKALNLSPMPVVDEGGTAFAPRLRNT